MVKITFIRHGESIDNLKSVWAGWKDSALTNHGVKQAEALALSLATTPLTSIYTSDLKRAKVTAQAVHAAQPKSTTLHTAQLLREQYFGAAEGASFKNKRDRDLTLKEHYAKGIYPPVYGRNERFPGGESPNDMSLRARRFIDEVLMPLVRQEEGKDSAHVAIVSHGLFIPELIALLWKMDGRPTTDEKELRKNLHGMRNTAWTRIDFIPQVCTLSDIVEQDSASSKSKAYQLKFLHVNCHTHLHALTRQKGGISRLAYDPTQKDIRNFFSKTKGS